jgi:mono/diheme cytochrome c family protein
MRTDRFTHILLVLSFAAIIVLVSAHSLRAQFTQNRDKIKIYASGYPAEIQKGYRLFRDKCNQCHGLDTSLGPSFSPAAWTSEVKRMQAMASSQFNDKQASAIIAFLNYDQLHRKALNKPPDSASSSSAASPGRQIYEAQNCDTCHSIAGQGGSAGPALTDVGNRLSGDRLLQVIQDMLAGKNDKMPPLPSDTTDEQIKSLVEYLSSLKGN